MDSVAHGIGVTNRYALFYDEDLDPLEILRQQEEEKLKRKTDKTTVKDKGKVTKSNKPAVTSTSPKKPVESVSMKSKVPENVESVHKPRGKPPTDRFQRSFGNNQDSKDFEDKKNTRNKDDQFFNSESKDRDTEFRRGRGGVPRGGRGGRGGDRGRGFYGNAENRNNRRMFDRHSGSDKTGVRPTDKREGAGSNNWGDIRSDINQRKDDVWDEEHESNTERAKEPTWTDDSTTEKKEIPTDVDNAETKENEPVPEESTEEAVKEMTLDEWKREQEAKRVVPKYNLRKPGEGEDDKMWKKGYVLKKKAKEEHEEEEEEDEDDEEYNRKQHRQLLDIQINFSDSRRGTRGRGRGGRGPPRTGPREGMPREERGGMRGGGRGGPREPSKMKGPQSAPRVDDFNDFPSLVNA